jgi:hypothetical protein
MIQLVLGIVADINEVSVGWGRSARAHAALFLLAAAPYCLAHDFVCNVQFQNPASISLLSVGTSSVLDDLHGSINLLLMRGTVL